MRDGSLGGDFDYNGKLVRQGNSSRGTRKIPRFAESRYARDDSRCQECRLLACRSVGTRNSFSRCGNSYQVEIPCWTSVFSDLRLANRMLNTAQTKWRATGRS